MSLSWSCFVYKISCITFICLTHGLAQIPIQQRACILSCYLIEKGRRRWSLKYQWVPSVTGYIYSMPESLPICPWSCQLEGMRCPGFWKVQLWYMGRCFCNAMFTPLEAADWEREVKYSSIMSEIRVSPSAL